MGKKVRLWSLRNSPLALHAPWASVASWLYERSCEDVGTTDSSKSPSTIYGDSYREICTARVLWTSYHHNTICCIARSWYSLHIFFLSRQVDGLFARVVQE